MGEYDKHAIKWLYSEFADNEAKRLDEIARDGVARGLVFLSDGDARGLGGADPRASLWDDGSDPAKALFDAMAVREIALKNFGPDRLPEGQPASAFKEVFVPIYLYHRYQVEAAAKLIGGVYYEHGINKGGVPQHRAVPLEDQRRALLLLLTCLDPQFLHVPDHIRPLLGPSSFGVSGRETFGSRTSPTFDSMQAAEVAADLVLAALLEPTRLERVAQDQYPHWLDELLSLMTARVFTEDPLPETWVVRTRYVDALMRIVGDPGLSLSVRAAAQKQLDAIVDSRTDHAEYSLLVAEIKRFNERPAGSTYAFPRPPVAPPGSPIGWGECFGG
jgi:hypothetical protein